MEPQPNSKRLTDYLRHYWDEKRGKKDFPALEDMDIQDLSSDFRRDCFLLEIIPTVTRFSVRTLFAGENLREEYVKDDSGVHIRHLVLRFLETPGQHYETVCKTRKPLEQNIELPGREGTLIRYRQILMPVGDPETKAVTGILGGMRYKKG